VSTHGRVFGSLRELRARLASISTYERVRHAYVGVQTQEQCLFAGAQGGIQMDPAEVKIHPVPAECLTKPLTATLLAEAARHLSWSDEIGELLGVAGAARDKLAGVSLARLLNHTHGLDSPTVARIPRAADGRIDIEALCNQLAAVPLSSPGRFYSYSNTGAWFVGALLERLSGRTYANLLYDRRLWPAISDSSALPAGDICPATGETLQLTMHQWLAFLSLHLRDPSQATASLRPAPVPLPGWCPSERAACMGWKHYGGTWFGHNSNANGSSALLRFDPEENIAIVIEASDDTAFLVLAGLFGDVLPEFSGLRPPRMLNSQERSALEPRRYTGSYVQAQSRLSVGIGTSARASECLTIEMQKSDGTTTAQRLRAAEDHIFIPESQDNRELPFIQFVAPEPTLHFGYLWNGKQLWRRE